MFMCEDPPSLAHIGTTKDDPLFFNFESAGGWVWKVDQGSLNEGFVLTLLC